MKKSLLFLLFAFGLWAGQGISQTRTPLKFGKDGKFKIVQFTDLHWNPRSPGCVKTTATMKHILQAEKPQLAILTGDVVTSPPAEEGWQAILEIFEEEKIPFTVTMGNHDAEQGYTRETIYDWLSRSAYFVGGKGPEDISGCGNFILEIQGSRSGLAALLYCVDSHDYPENTRLYGAYDWIKHDQIEWYRRQSERYKKNNGNQPLPALAFFHIPLPEHQAIVGGSTTIGHIGEAVSCPRINSAFFSSMVDQGDVMGVFTGHDHGNDYIGIHCGIALGFGRTTGADAESRGELETGGRVIELYEGRRRFDTWLRTAEGKAYAYYYPSGLSSEDEKTLTYQASEKVKPCRPGVRYIYYEGEYESTNELTPATEMKRGVLPNFTLKEATAKDYFGYAFHTWIHIPERGVYRFYTYSDDGSKLFIDGNVIVDNDGSHSSRYMSGKVALEAGFHALKLLYFESYMGEKLEVGITGREMEETIIPDEMLFLPE